MTIETTRPGDRGFDDLAKSMSGPPRLNYKIIAEKYNAAEVFSILTLQKGQRVTHLGNVRKYLERWGLTRHTDFVAKVIICDEDQEMMPGAKRLIIEKRTPKEMVRPSK